MLTIECNIVAVIIKIVPKITLPIPTIPMFVIIFPSSAKICIAHNPKNKPIDKKIIPGIP